MHWTGPPKSVTAALRLTLTPAGGALLGMAGRREAAAVGHAGSRGAAACRVRVARLQVGTVWSGRLACPTDSRARAACPAARLRRASHSSATVRHAAATAAGRSERAPLGSDHLPPDLVTSTRAGPSTSLTAGWPLAGVSRSASGRAAATPCPRSCWTTSAALSAPCWRLLCWPRGPHCLRWR